MHVCACVYVLTSHLCIAESGRKRDGLGHAEGQSKKPRVSDGSPHHSPNTPSPQLTSPVIKLIHYNPAGEVPDGRCLMGGA